MQWEFMFLSVCPHVPPTFAVYVFLESRFYSLPPFSLFHSLMHALSMVDFHLFGVCAGYILGVCVSKVRLKMKQFRELFVFVSH